MRQWFKSLSDPKSPSLGSSLSVSIPIVQRTDRLGIDSSDVKRRQKTHSKHSKQMPHNNNCHFCLVLLVVKFCPTLQRVSLDSLSFVP